MIILGSQQWVKYIKVHNKQTNNNTIFYNFNDHGGLWLGHVVLLWPAHLHIKHLFLFDENDSPTPCLLLYGFLLNLIVLSSIYRGGINLPISSTWTTQNSSRGTGVICPTICIFHIFPPNNIERSARKLQVHIYDRIELKALP